MKKVLLVNLDHGKQSFHVNFVPLGLLKLSTYYKNKNYEIYYTSCRRKTTIKPDIICFSPVFLFNLKKDLQFILSIRNKFPEAFIRIGGISASLKPEIFKKIEGNIEVITGLQDYLDDLAPDFNIARTTDCYGFTSRGCKNNCKWCVVPKIEGKIRIANNWELSLDSNKRLFMALDNNLLACGPDHVDNVLKKVKEKNLKIDVNQAMDCVLFAKNEDYARIFKKYNNFYKIRFAWDSKRQDKYIDKTIELLNKHKISGTRNWYCLYGFKDEPEIYYNRIKHLMIRKQSIKPMRYRDIDSGHYKIGWGGFYDKFTEWCNSFSVRGVMGGTSNLKNLGNNFKEFCDIIDLLNVMKQTKVHKQGTTLIDSDFEKILKAIRKK